MARTPELLDATTNERTTQVVPGSGGGAVASRVTPSCSKRVVAPGRSLA
jgi:hypothetical protein